VIPGSDLVEFMPGRALPPTPAGTALCDDPRTVLTLARTGDIRLPEETPSPAGYDAIRRCGQHLTAFEICGDQAGE